MGMPTTRQGLAEALGEARLRSGMSLRRLAKEAGVSASTLQGWFEGKHLPTLALQGQFLSLVRLLGLTAEATESQWLLALGRLRANGHVGGNPYVGMRAYGPDDAEHYFGRQVLLDELVAAVEKAQTAPGARLVAVVGVSGAGKTSLLQAGLIGIECRGGRLGRFTCMTAAPEELAGWEAPPEDDVLLVVDHVERVRAMPEDTAHATLTALASLPRNVTCVFGLTADSFGFVAADGRLRQALAAPVLVGTLTEEEFRDIICRPAELSGRPVDDALVTLILKSLWRYGEPPASVLPMLSNSLRQAWDEASGATVTVDDYLARGGIWGGLERLAEGIYDAASPSDQLGIRSVFLDLVQISSDGIERRQIDVGHLPEESLPLVEEYLSARLLTLEGNLVSIGHSALLGRWKRLGSWVEEEREQLMFRRRIAKAAEVWEESNRDPQALIPVEALVFDQFARRTDVALTPLETDFFEASVARAEEETRAQRGEVSKLRRRNALISVLAVVAVFGVVLALIQVRRADSFSAAADQARAEAQSRQLALLAEEARGSDRNTAAQLSLAALETARTPEAQAAVLKSAGMGVPHRVTGPAGTTRVASLDDGAVLVRADASGSVALWRDTALDEDPVTFSPGDGQLFAVALAEVQGRVLAAVAGQQTASLWDVTQQPEKLGEFSTEEVGYSAAFGPETVYFGVQAGRVLRISLADLNGLEPLPEWNAGASGDILALQVTAQEAVLAGSGSQLVLWDADSLVRTVEMGGTVFSTNLSPDGRSVVVGGANGLLQAVSLDAGDPLEDPLATGGSAVTSVLHLGDAVAAGYGDGAVRVLPLDGSPGREWFEPTSVTGLLQVRGRYLTAALDGAVRWWPSVPDGLLRPAQPDPRFFIPGRGWLPELTPEGIRLISTHDPEQPPLELAAPEGVGLRAVVAVGEDVVSAPTDDGRIVAWPLVDGRGGEPTVSRIVEEGVAYQFPSDGSAQVALLEPFAVEEAVVVRREGTRWTEVGVVPTFTTLASDISDDGALLAAVSVDSKSVVLYDIAGSVEPLGEVELVADGAAISATFAPGDERLYLATDAGDLMIVDTSEPQQPQLLRTVRDSHTGLSSVSVNPDGSVVAATNSDGRVLVWDAADDEFPLLYQLRPSLGSLGDVDLYDGQITVGGNNGAVFTWGVDVASARTQVCEGLGDLLSPDEWRAIVPGIESMRICG